MSDLRQLSLRHGAIAVISFYGLYALTPLLLTMPPHRDAPTGRTYIGAFASCIVVYVLANILVPDLRNYQRAMDEDNRRPDAAMMTGAQAIGVLLLAAAFAGLVRAHDINALVFLMVGIALCAWSGFLGRGLANMGFESRTVRKVWLFQLLGTGLSINAVFLFEWWRS